MAFYITLRIYTGGRAVCRQAGEAIRMAAEAYEIMPAARRVFCSLQIGQQAGSEADLGPDLGILQWEINLRT